MIGQDLRKPTDAQPLDALLELQRRDAARSHNRSSERFGIQCRIDIHPGNSSERGDAKPLQAVCSDLSSGGCRLFAPHPPQVGDIYWLVFEKSVDVSPVFARCVRCRLLREDAYESGFQFFSEVRLPQDNRKVEDDVADVV